MSGYDEKLLSSAPSATKAERQQGYDPALLEDGPAQPVAAPSTSPIPPKSGYTTSGAQYAPVKESQSSTELPGRTTSNKKAVPFWRTRKGQIIIAVIVLVVLGVIGGVVGGVLSKKKKSPSSTTTNPDNAAPSTTGPSGPSVSSVTGAEGQSSSNVLESSSRTGTVSGIGGIRSSTTPATSEVTATAQLSQPFASQSFTQTGASPTDLSAPPSQEGALAGF